MILDKVNEPQDLRNLSIDEMNTLAGEMRELIIKKVNTTEDFKKLVYNCMLCNDSRLLEDGQLAGDPTETALVDMGMNLDIDIDKIFSIDRLNEIPFDSSRKLMTTVHKIDNEYIVYTKGGVDELLKNCTSYIINGKIEKDLEEFKKSIYENNESMAKNALRVLAFGYKKIKKLPESKEKIEKLESDLIFVGMVGMIDPPREEAKKAVEKCKSAGIKTVMITGDHKITATAIAKQLGILENEDEAITGSELENMSDEELCKSAYGAMGR